MEKFIALIKKNIKHAEKRFQSASKDIDSGLENNNGVDGLASRCLDAQKEQARFKFFKTIEIRYQADVEMYSDIPAFKSFCLDIVAGEFTDRTRCPELTKMRSELLKAITPYLTK